MDKNLELQLVQDYPDLYKDYDGDERKTCMHWGFEHNNGWLEIIKELSEKLKLISEVSGIEIVADQVKSKFGTLSYYYSTNRQYDKTSPDYLWLMIIRDVVIMAERKSAVTCELCGEYGKIRPGGWIRTLCEGCNKNKYKRYL